MTSFIVFGSTKSSNRSSILIFANESDRNASIGESPISSVFTYVAETGYLEFWNGTEWIDFVGPTGPAAVANILEVQVFS
jgi:hypothetical protein